MDKGMALYISIRLLLFTAEGRLTLRRPRYDKMGYGARRIVHVLWGHSFVKIHKI